MLGNRMKKLDETAARLEAAAARLEHQDRIAVDVSPEVRDAVIVATEATLNAILVDVHAAIVAGQHNKATLLAAVRMPLIRVLAQVPEAQMASATLTVVSTLISRLIDKLLELELAMGRN